MDEHSRSIPEIESWSTVEQVADHLAVSKTTVYELCLQGLPYSKVGKARRFKLTVVDQWIEARSAEVSEGSTCACTSSIPGHDEHQSDAA